MLPLTAQASARVDLRRKCTEPLCTPSYARCMTAVCELDIDEARHAWIVGHQSVSMIQRRRAEVLVRQLRARARRAANAACDPHDDTVIPPLWLRAAKSPASRIEMFVVVAAALIAP